MKNHISSSQSHMKMLCETIGTRPTGSNNNRAALDYAFNVFQKSGLQTIKQEFECMDWQKSGAILSIGSQNIPVEPAEYSLPCDIEAEYICIDTVGMLENSQLQGKIAVMYGDLCKEPIMPKNFEFYNPDEHKRIIALLEEKQPMAIIAVSPLGENIIQDGDFNIPCAVVKENTLDFFTGSNVKKIRLAINTERIPARAHNVIARFGTGSNKVCFSAHIDTKPTTPGALDNASGVSALLSLANSLSGNTYPFQIEFVLFNGEDYYSTPGEITFMRQLTKDYILAINVDGIGLKGGNTSISFYKCTQGLENRFMECVKNVNGIERIEPWPMGDHMVFVNEGIPAVSITASKIFDMIGAVIHTEKDDMSNIDINIIDNVTSFLSNILNRGGW